VKHRSPHPFLVGPDLDDDWVPGEGWTDRPALPVHDPPPSPFAAEPPGTAVDPPLEQGDLLLDAWRDDPPGPADSV
jgi:hypothetical protein